MNEQLETPLRPLEWPEIVYEITRHVDAAARLYLVGGIVRDALRGRPSLDIDLVTPDDGLAIARQLADALEGAYYPVDADRHTGRAVLNEGMIQIDVATYRGDTLLDDLRGRDFTINAIAVRMDQLDKIYDPLEGQQDLVVRKWLRMADDTSISNDPIRILRSIRMALAFGLRMEPVLVQELRRQTPLLADDEGHLKQPERVRDELFKLIQKTDPSAAYKLLRALGVLEVILPAPPDAAPVIKALSQLTRNISRRRDDNSAANMLYGVAVMVLDRYRQALQAYLESPFSNGRTRLGLLYVSQMGDRAALAEWLKLSNDEKHFLAMMDRAAAHHFDFVYDHPPTAVDIHRIYRAYGPAMIEATLLALAHFIAQGLTVVNPVEWGMLLDDHAAPILDAYFNHYDSILEPEPLMTGDDLLTAHPHIAHGPLMGEVLQVTLEAQIAGEVQSTAEAQAFAGAYLSKIGK